MSLGRTEPSEVGPYHAIANTVLVPLLEDPTAAPLLPVASLQGYRQVTELEKERKEERKGFGSAIGSWTPAVKGLMNSLFTEV